MPLATLPLTHIGWKAQAALAATRGRAHVLARLSTSLYLTAADQVIWLGNPGAAVHPRTMVVSTKWLGHLPASAEIAFDFATAREWPVRRQVPVGARLLQVPAARAMLGMLRQNPPCLPPPRGLGALLVGGQPPFPLERAVPAIVDLAQACQADRVTEAASAAESLLGLGPGLTPAGDDFVGGMLFARNREDGTVGAAWRQASTRLIVRARRRTNPISSALLGDLAEGHGYEALHELTEALERGIESRDVLDAVRRLAHIGGSSGWDLLAGFLVGIAGMAALGRP